MFMVSQPPFNHYLSHQGNSSKKATSAEHLSNLAGLLHRAALLAERSGGANRGFVCIASCAQAHISTDKYYNIV